MKRWWTERSSVLYRIVGSRHVRDRPENSATHPPVGFEVLQPNRRSSHRRVGISPSWQRRNMAVSHDIVCKWYNGPPNGESVAAVEGTRRAHMAFFVVYHHLRIPLKVVQGSQSHTRQSIMICLHRFASSLVLEMDALNVSPRTLGGDGGPGPHCHP